MITIKSSRRQYMAKRTGRMLMELLEHRLLLSALAVNIDFQPATVKAPAGYLVDAGNVFGNRGNGYSYGWTAANYRTMQRNSSRSPDVRYDTFIVSQPTFMRPNLAWKLALPNGLYNVHIVAGDPSNSMAYYATSANGTLVINGQPTSAARWIEGTAVVPVSNGTLTLTSGSSAWNNTLDFIQVSDAAPTNLSAAVSSPHQINLTWKDNANGEQGYTVLRSADGVNYKTIATLAANTTTYADTGLTDGATYYYQVRAFAGGTSGVATASAAIPLAAPTALTVTNVAYNHVDLSWSNQSTGATGNVVQESSDGVTFQNVAQLGAGVSSYSDTTVTPGTTCYYRVCAMQGKVQAPSAVVNAAVPLPGVYAANSGAVGDGVTNDSPALQAAIDAAPSGATLYLQAGKTYLLNKGLVVNKPLNFEGNGATLLLNTSASPQNITLLYRSPVSSTQYTWTKPVVAGQTTFQVAVPVSDIAAGDMIDLQLGQDPYDANQPHYERVFKVVANTGSSITVDQPIPYDIVQGNLPNSIRKITSLVENSTIRNLRLDQNTGIIPDAQVAVDRARNIIVQNLSGRFTIAVGVTNSQNVSIDGITGQLQNLHVAAGRTLGVWQSDNVSETNVNVTSDSNQPAIFLESWAHNISVTNFHIDYQTTQQIPWVFGVVGGSYGVYGDQIHIDNSVPVALVDTGGGPGTDYHFGTVIITGPVLWVPLNSIDTLQAGTAVFRNPVHTDITVTLRANDNGTLVPLVYGTIKDMKITASSTDGILALNSFNSQYSGFGFAWLLVAGQPYDQSGFYGINWAYNSIAAPQKYLQSFTSATLPPDTTLTFSIDYYPST